MLWGILYVVGFVSIYIWDTFIGLGVDFDDYGQPPLALVAGLWFISAPILLIYNFGRLLDYFKNKRLKRKGFE